MAGRAPRAVRLPPEVNRILYVRNLPYKISAEELFEVFGRYGAIRQVRVGNERTTQGTAFVVYEDIYYAKAACEHLSGFNVGGRYLVVMYYAPKKSTAGVDMAKATAEVEALRARVAAGEAAAGEGDGEGEDSLDDEADKRIMGRR